MRSSETILTYLRQNPFATLTTLLLVLPIVMGLGANLFSAVGFGIGVQNRQLSMDAIQSFFAWPGIGNAAFLSLWSGFCAAFFSLTATIFILIKWAEPNKFVFAKQLLAPLLAIPHAAAAFGFAFLLAPSGWLVRLVSPWLTGWDRPLDLLIIHDPLALSLIFGLVVKEVPFLLLISLAALRQINQSQRLIIGQSMGYSRASSWLIGVLPSLYLRVRLPVLVVLTWSMSVVDVALILGPTAPPTLAVQILRWMSDPDIGFRNVASVGALVQLLLCLLAVAVWFAGEWIVRKSGTIWSQSGRRGRGDRLVTSFASALIWLILFVLLAGIVSHIIWSFSGLWQFPNFVPEQLTLRSWSRHWQGLQEAWAQTAIIAGLSLGIGLILTIGCLEIELRTGKTARLLSWIIYVPLLVPQVAFLPGVQTGMLMMGINGGVSAVVFAHLIYVIPYLRLILAGDWQNWEPRYDIVSLTMGASKNRIFWRIRAPMLLASVLTATAVAVSVSVGQYLPTLLIGGGRIETLTTEAVALFSGGDRRAIGVFSLAQTVAVLLPFFIAIFAPRLMWRNRRGLVDG